MLMNDLTWRCINQVNAEEKKAVDEQRDNENPQSGEVNEFYQAGFDRC
jgi:histidyl-tRNA synthetase